MGIRPEDILPDEEDTVNLKGKVVRKGSIAAFLKNIDLFENAPDAQTKESALAMLEELAPALISADLHKHASFKNPTIQSMVDRAEQDFKKQFQIGNLPMSPIKTIDVIPYDPQWPHIFEEEAALIRQALGDNCVSVHHIGSTSVPGLDAKPKIDIIAEVKEGRAAIDALERNDFTYKGEWNIPFKFGFTKRGIHNVNLHVFEEGHPDIALQLLFRDYLCQHPSIVADYARLKYALLEDEESHKKNNALFVGYTLGKHDFIEKILADAGFTGQRFVRCAHYCEWDQAKYFRNTYFFGPHGIEDPYTWTFTHTDHAHLLLYEGVTAVGYAHLQFWPENRAALRIIVIHDEYRNQGFGTVLLKLCEKWLKTKGVVCLHVESRPSSLDFYRRNGYEEMPFMDPDHHESDPQDVSLGKRL